MADTIRARSALLTLLADNTSGDISAQDMRDVALSLFRRQFRTITGDLTLGADDDYILVDATSANPTVTLPAAATCPGRRYTVKQIAGEGYGRIATQVDGQALVATSQFPLTVVSDGSAWYFLNRSA